ncbi:MAG: crossover junction endodeoxyribonuclease RuvC [Puniceicoccales bacterium]|jgi:crossover junction endodeoxyribonuclease RuvC|nr:crossover junction endodeoxyribonuclease RuvC [Puniceicoccales bacterium]
MSVRRRHLWTNKILGLSKKASHPKDIRADFDAFQGFILGIDPSLRSSGFAVIEIGDHQKINLHTSSTLKLSPRLDFVVCLGELFKATQYLLQSYPVCAVSMEQTIYVQNSKVAQILGSCRGACLAAVALSNVETKEYTPRRIKKSITGMGQATKEQVAKMVCQLLQLPRILPPDESDATATALCHFFSLKSLLPS